MEPLDDIQTLPRERARSSVDLASIAAVGARELKNADALTVVRWAQETFAGTCVATQSMVNTALADVIDAAGADIPIIFVDTGLHFRETLETRDRLALNSRLAVLSISSPITVDEQAAGFGPDLWARDPDRCCAVRKVDPIEGVLALCEAWLTGVRATTTVERSKRNVVEFDSVRGVVKINPLLGWSDRELDEYTRSRKVVVNPLVAKGFPSIGCWPCTRSVAADEDPRSGRWSGFEKTECGLHI